MSTKAYLAAGMSCVLVLMAVLLVAYMGGDEPRPSKSSYLLEVAVLPHVPGNYTVLVPVLVYDYGEVVDADYVRAVSGNVTGVERVISERGPALRIDHFGAFTMRVEGEIQGSRPLVYPSLLFDRDADGNSTEWHGFGENAIWVYSSDDSHALFNLRYQDRYGGEIFEFTVASEMAVGWKAYEGEIRASAP